MAVSLARFLLGQRALSRDGLDVALGDPGVARAVVGAGLFAAACSVLGVALGALVRHATGAITVTVLVLFGAQLVTDVLPGGVARVVPHWAGFALFTLDPDRFDSPPMLAPWAGFAVFCAYVAATLGAAALLVQRRDTSGPTGPFRARPVSIHPSGGNPQWQARESQTAQFWSPEPIAASGGHWSRKP